MIDKNVKQRKLSRFLQNVNYLKKIRSLKEEEFLADYQIILASLHAIQESIQICIDLAFHICAINKFPEPDTYRSAFNILAQNQIIDIPLSKKLQNWAGLRNIIAHLYDDIDYKKMYSAIKEDLDDLDVFIGITLKLEDL